jgi:pimeloyl-ACP methyl ester carboxylesterase
MRTFVLVHGSFSGGWMWRAVADDLRAGGDTVFAPTLTGLGDRRHLAGPTVTLRTHIEDIANLFYYEDLSDVTLVGHSYAGMVIAGVAAIAPERLGRLIYLDAYVPHGGQSWFDLQTPEDAAIARAEMDRTGARSPIPASMLGITDPVYAASVDARMTPQGRATYEDPCPMGSAASAAIPCAYIQCTEGPLAVRLRRSAELARTQGWEVRELACGHNAMLILPNQLADLLRELTADAA